VHLVGDGQAFGGLHQRQHELPRHQARLAHAVGANVVSHHRIPCDFDGGEVVEHHRQVFVDQGTHQGGQAGAERIAVFVDHVHSAQQMLVLRRTLGKTEVQWQRHRLQPAQHAELAAGVA